MAEKEDFRIYLLQGRDDYSKEKALEALLEKTTSPEFAVFDVDEYSGQSAEASTILTGAGILPAGSPRRVVLVKYANKMPPDQQRELAKNLYMVPESGCVILVVPAPEMKDGRPAASSSVVSELSAAVRKTGKVMDFEPVTKKRDIETQVVPFVKRLFAERDTVAEPAAVDLLISRVGTDYTLLAFETDKLCAYCRDTKKVTAKDVRECSSLTPEERVFEFMDALLGRQGALALRLAEELFTEGSDPAAAALRLMSLLAGQHRQLWQARIILEKGPRTGGKAVTEEDMGEYAGLFAAPSLLKKQPWLQKRFTDMARRTGFPALAAWIRIAADTDAALKGAEGLSEEPQDIIKMMVFDMIREASDNDRRLG